MRPGRDLLDAGLRLQETVTGHQTFIYRGRHWPCIAGGLRRGMDLGMGPPVNELARTIIVRKSAIPVRTVDASEGWTADSTAPTADEDVMPPHPGKKIIFEQREYEVESVEEDGAGAAWKVNLVSPDQ